MERYDFDILTDESNEIDKDMVHIHVHSWFSLLDGHGSPATRAKRAKELGMKAMALTDHNHIGGCVDFQKACKEEGIKPLLGVELYYTNDTSILSKDVKEREAIALEAAKAAGVEIQKKALKKDIKALIEPYTYDTKQHHIIFIAKNQLGWNNLVRLQSEAARVCTYNGRHLCDDDMIAKYKEGLIMTTACLGSIVSQLILSNKYDEARRQLNKWHRMFGDDFYIEIQPLNEIDQALVNSFLLEYAVANNIKVVASNDVHYATINDIDDHDTLLCIGLGKNKNDLNRMRYAPEFWIRSYDEMTEAFTNQYDDNRHVFGYSYEEYMELIRKALKETTHLADKVSEDIKLGSDETILPKLEIPHGFTAEEYLSLCSYKGLFKYIKTHPEINMYEYLDRLEFELNVINSKGYADYMLIVKDIVSWCKENDIPVGPGRGSASGSLCLFVNEITKCIDPIKYGLLFSRFLTMDRTALPDIDTDFSYLRRHEVIQYLKDKYGEDCVSFIGTYTELGVKNGLKDVGRVLGVDYSTMDILSKKVTEWTDDAPSIKFKDLDKLHEGNDKDKQSYIEFKEYEAKYPEIFRLARVFEGTPRNQGVHASGILVTPMPINDIFPTRLDDEGNLVTLYTGPVCEELGSCKIDILGLKTLDVLDLTVKADNPNATVYDLYDIVDKHLDDEVMFEKLKNKETEGIFQLESNLFKGLVSDMLPDELDDITLITSFGRPGPLSAGLHTQFAKRKRGEEEAVEPLPNTWDIVEDSLGVLA